jgi:ribonuclease HI
MRVTIYTDGGADPNPGVGGWAAILIAGGHEKLLQGSERWTTNNRMELQAAVAALSALTKPAEVDLYTDSEYLSKGITEWIERWSKADFKRKGKPIPNADLWQILWELEREHQVEWHWVRGHSGNDLNERVDRLARLAREEIAPVVKVDVDAPNLFVRASCRGNPGPGGWGAVLEFLGETEQTSGSDPNTTNNRMELTGVVEGLRMLPENSTVIVHTTSDYVYTGATRWIKGWRKRDWRKKDGKPISNLDLWQELDRLMANYAIRWVSAKGRQNRDSQSFDDAAKLATAAIDMEK